MYHTSLGNRILLGAERHLFSACLGMIVDMLADDDTDFGLEAFDTLQRNQKLAALYLAARGLLLPQQSPPKLTAFLEAAVATVYLWANEMVQQELNFAMPEEDDTAWRELVLQAAQEASVTDQLPDVRCDDPSRWHWLIDCLSDRILWDQDYALTAAMDVSPEKRRELQATLGVDGDYFTDVAPDPPASQTDLYVDALRGLTAIRETLPISDDLDF
jgi:hypothetical protein